MKLLPDTHVILWWLLGSPRLSEELRELLNTEPEVYISAVSPWEVSVKQALGKIEGPADLPERVRDSQLKPLPITGEYGVLAGRLPLHHRDPFDRMLIAQAQAESMTVITRDKWIPKYDVPVMLA